MRELRRWVADRTTCAYLPDRDASLEYRLLTDVTAEELEPMLERGWRRFGFAYFRPRCGPCSECVPLRIPTASFRPSRQQRRARNKTQGLRVEIGEPIIDAARLELYRAWHDMQADQRGWASDDMTAEEYYYQFAFPHPAVRELAYWDDEPADGGEPRLVAVSIVDETPNALSAVYTYHHPDYRKRSLGTGSILFQVALAQRAAKAHVYLGYRVFGCMSSEYKARFHPHELLVGWPEPDETPRWVRAEAHDRGAEDDRED